MIQTASSTLLLYPEWIVWVSIVLAFANIGVSILILITVSSRRAGITEQCDILSQELTTLRRQYRELRDRHHERRDALSELGLKYDRLKREYDELWREHQETCNLLGPLLPGDKKTPGGTGRIS